MSKSIFIFFSGTAGAGKNTVIDNLIANEPERFLFLNSHTSREKRPDDKNGRYNYVSQEEFEKLIEENKILEYDMFNGKYYGISKEEINKLSKENKVVLKDLSVKGVLNCKEIFKDDLKIKGVFLTNTKKVLKERLLARNYSKDQIKNRLKLYKKEQSKITHYDYVIFNDNLESTLEKCKAISKTIENDSPILLAESYQNISQKKIDKLVQKLSKNKKLNKITAFSKNGNIYIESGANEFLAGLKCKKIPAIFLNNTPSNFIEENIDQSDWLKLVKTYSWKIAKFFIKNYLNAVWHFFLTFIHHPLFNLRYFTFTYFIFL